MCLFHPLDSQFGSISNGRTPFLTYESASYLWGKSDTALDLTTITTAISIR